MMAEFFRKIVEASFRLHKIDACENFEAMSIKMYFAEEFSFIAHNFSGVINQSQTINNDLSEKENVLM